MIYILVEDYKIGCEKYSDIIGVPSSKENANKMIKDYFGEDIKELSHRDVEDSGIEWVKTLDIQLTQNQRATTTVSLLYYKFDTI